MSAAERAKFGPPEDQMIVDGIDYGTPRRGTVVMGGDTAQGTQYPDVNAIWLEVMVYLEQTKKMHKTGVNRWTFAGRSGANDPNVEVGTVLGEVRIRIYQGGQKVGTVDIRSSKHLHLAKKRIHTYLQQADGKRWVKGEGWVAA